jgi:hypothetical protein
MSTEEQIRSLYIEVQEDFRNKNWDSCVPKLKILAEMTSEKSPYYSEVSSMVIAISLQMLKEKELISETEIKDLLKN